MNKQQAELLNGIALSYVGDSIFEVFVRDYLLEKGLTKPAFLQKNATKFVSAKAQAKIIRAMEEVDFLTEYELTYFKRGRNAHSKTTAKNTDVVTYRISTGFEALMGYLALSDQQKRVAELGQWCIEQVEAGRTEK